MNPVGTGVEGVLLKVLVQLIVIIAAARVLGTAFRWLGQPQVCGEIAAGLILGPSLLGRLAPGVSGMVFSPSVGGILSIFSQLGLILLLFLIGLEFDFAHLKARGRAAISISAAGIALPFILGIGVGELLYPVVGQGINKTGFLLFIATALSITAIPILGRIMIELNIHRTYIGSLTITAAAVDDATGWILLTVVATIVRSMFNPVQAILMAVETAGFAVVMFNVVRPILKKWIRKRSEREGDSISLTTLTVMLLLVLSSAVVTNLIGIFSIFGAFLAGAILFDEERFRTAVTARLRDFTVAFFLPIFFTYTGLRTDIGSMENAGLWLLCGLVLLAAIVGKFGGCTLAARWSGLSWRNACAVGVMMNTRALMELIVINLGFELGVIPRSVFFMLVFMAVVTTYMTTPVLRRTIRTTEMEPLLAASQFMMNRPTLR
jgi:Kef-type K+ transport system membrane component KefB